MGGGQPRNKQININIGEIISLVQKQKQVQPAVTRTIHDKSENIQIRAPDKGEVKGFGHLK